MGQNSQALGQRFGYPGRKSARNAYLQLREDGINPFTVPNRCGPAGVALRKAFDVSTFSARPRT